MQKKRPPPAEYLTPLELVEMAKGDNIDFLALSENDSFVGFRVVQTHKTLSYLFFLAIDSSLRSKGYGSRAIETLVAEYPGKIQTVAFEMPDKTAENYLQRLRRREFYLMNDYQETGLFLWYPGVDYEIFCMGRIFDPELFKEMMQTIKVERFKPEYFTWQQ